MNSVADIMFGQYVYKTKDIYLNSIANDFMSIFYGIIMFILLTDIRDKTRRIRIGFYLIFAYSSTANIFLVDNPLSFIANAILSLISVFIFFMDISSLHVNMDRTRFKIEFISALALIILGLAFLIRSVGIIMNFRSDMVSSIEFATSISDALICSVWLIISILVLANNRFGLSAIIPILTQSSLLFISLLIYLPLNSMINGNPIPLIDIFVVSLMSLIVVIPYMMVLRTY